MTAAPRSHRHRTWLYLRPQSTAVIRRDPPGLNTRGVCRGGECGDQTIAPGPLPALQPSSAPGTQIPPAIPSVTPPARDAACWGPQRGGCSPGSHLAPASPAASPSHGSSLLGPEYPPLQKGRETRPCSPIPPRAGPHAPASSPPQLRVEPWGANPSAETGLVPNSLPQHPRCPPAPPLPLRPTAQPPAPPARPGMFCSLSHWWRERDALQWLGVSEHSPTTKAATWILLDSNHCRSRV